MDQRRSIQKTSGSLFFHINRLEIKVSQRDSAFLSSYLLIKSKFRKIEDDQIMGVLLEFHYVSYGSGQVIYDEDDKATDLFFIYRGQIELSKRIPSQVNNLQHMMKILAEYKSNLRSHYITLASFNSGQVFGDIEIIQKTKRTTRARVISPKLEAYKINKQRFFDNLGSFRVYEMMKKNCEMMSQFHQNSFNKQIQEIISEKDEQQVMIQIEKQKKGFYSKGSSSIINNRVLQHHKGNSIKAFQNLANNELIVHQDSSFVSQNQHGNQQNTYEQIVQNRDVLQKIYSNSLQNYLDKIIEKKTQNITDSIRGIQNAIPGNPINNQSYSILKTPLLSNRNITQISSNSPRDQNLNDLNESSLPNIYLSLVQSEPQKKSIKPVVQSIGNLPKITRENLVLSIMRQNAQNSKNPEREFRKIEQTFELAAFKAMRGKKKQIQKQHLSSQAKNLQLLKVLDIEGIMKKKKTIQDQDILIRMKSVI